MPSIKASDVTEINLAPETEAEDIQQCMGMILNSYKNSIPFMRGFGMSTAHYGKPMAGVENEIVDELYEQMDQYEPRVDISDAEFEDGTEGGQADYTVPFDIVSEEEEDEE